MSEYYMNQGYGFVGYEPNRHLSQRQVKVPEVSRCELKVKYNPDAPGVFLKQIITTADSFNLMEFFHQDYKIVHLGLNQYPPWPDLLPHDEEGHSGSGRSERDRTGKGPPNPRSGLHSPYTRQSSTSFDEPSRRKKDGMRTPHSAPWSQGLEYHTHKTSLDRATYEQSHGWKYDQTASPNGPPSSYGEEPRGNIAHHSSPISINLHAVDAATPLSQRVPYLTTSTTTATTTTATTHHLA